MDDLNDIRRRAGLPLKETSEKWIKAYRAEGAGRGVMGDAILGGTYFFPDRSRAEMWAGGRGKIIEATVRIDNASFQSVPEGEAQQNHHPVVVRTDPEGSGQIMEIIVFDKRSIRLIESMTPAQAVKVFLTHGVDPRGMDKGAIRKARTRIALKGKVHPDRGGSTELSQELNAAADVLMAQPQAAPAGAQPPKPEKAGAGTPPGKKPGWRPFTDFVKQYQDVQKGPRPTKVYRGSA